MAKRKLSGHDPARDAMMLIEFARNPRPAVIGRKFGVHHSYVKRLWQSLSDEEKNAYKMKSEDVKEIAAEKIIEEQSDAIAATTSRLMRLADMSLDEYERRLSNPQLKQNIKDKDLISFIARSLAIVRNTADKDNDDDSKATNDNMSVFDMFDQSIQDNITNKLT